MRLKDKVVVITGAGSGLGRECALLFAEHGARVVVADVDAERASTTATAVADAGGTAIAVTADVSNEAQVKGIFASTRDAFGKLDVMYNNAGIQVPGYPTTKFEDFTAEQWRRVVDVNLTGVFYGCKHAIPMLKANGGGSIIVTSSAVALRSTRNLAPYSATKGAVNALVRSLAIDLGAYGIRVNAICPLHGMSTNFLTPDSAEVTGRSIEESRGPWDSAAARMPLKLERPPTLRDNALAALYFASDDSQYTSGVCMPTTDGGILGGFYVH